MWIKQRLNFSGAESITESVYASGIMKSADQYEVYSKQNGNILTSEYKGGQIIIGHLIGMEDEEGNIKMRYHQVNKIGELITGVCHSKPELNDNGKIRLYENWKWTSADMSSGQSILEEI